MEVPPVGRSRVRMGRLRIAFSRVECRRRSFDLLGYDTAFTCCHVHSVSVGPRGVQAPRGKPSYTRARRSSTAARRIRRCALRWPHRRAWQARDLSSSGNGLHRIILLQVEIILPPCAAERPVPPWLIPGGPTWACQGSAGRHHRRGSVHRGYRRRRAGAGPCRSGPPNAMDRRSPQGARPPPADRGLDRACLQGE